MRFIIGKKDEFQIDENLFCISDNQVRRVSYQLKQTPTYFDKIIEPNYLPPELWSIVFDYMVHDFLKSHNYELVAELMLISKSLLLKFYKTYIEQDLSVYHHVSIPTKFSRVVGILQTAELIYEEMYSSIGVVYQIDLFLNRHLKQNVPMPWDVLKVKPFISLNHPIMILDLDLETVHNPTVFRISNTNAFLDGETIESLVTPTYFRLPILILSLFNYNGNGPLVTLKLLKSSTCWKSLFDILRIGLGEGSGIYHSVNVTSLPDEYIFHNEIFIES